MGDLVQLDLARGTSRTHDDEPLVCSCGSSWFELCTIDATGTKTYGAVVVNQAGSVTGYSGTPHCLSCGRENLP
jgi:hypothetical protein